MENGNFGGKSFWPSNNCGGKGDCALEPVSAVYCRLAKVQQAANQTVA